MRSRTPIPGDTAGHAVQNTANALMQRIEWVDFFE
jgi:hypothetical protein